MQEGGKHLEEEDKDLEGQQPHQVHGQFQVHPALGPLLPLECDHSLQSQISLVNIASSESAPCLSPLYPEGSRLADCFAAVKLGLVRQMTIVI